jgi:hypothetical protein
MEPSIENFIDNTQDHTLTWLLYQLCLKLNMDYGYVTNVLLYDITKFLSDDQHRYWVDLILLTWLFYYLWKGKVDLEANKSKVSYKIIFYSASLSYIILKWDLDMFLWVTIFTIVFCFILADIGIFISKMLQYNLVKILLIIIIIYATW